MVAKTLYDRPARGLVLSAAALCAFVLAVTVIGHFAFDAAMRHNARDARTLVAAGRLEVDAVRVKDDATTLATNSNERLFDSARTKLRKDCAALQSDHALVADDPKWRAPASCGSSFTLLSRSATQMNDSPSPQTLSALQASVTDAAAIYEADMRRALSSYSAHVAQRMSRRLWTCGALFPGGCAFVIVGIAALLLPPALHRLRKVNEMLIALEAASAAQAAELEQRNTALQEQQVTLRASQAELILKTQQLESSSLGSQQAARRFEELFQGLPVACVGFSDQGLVFEWNRASSDMFGHDAYQVLHHKLWGCIADHASARRGASIVRQVFLGKEFRNTEWEYTRPDGQRRHILGHFFPLRGVDGRILGGVAACLDVTDRKRAEEELRSSEKLFRDLIDSLHEGVLLYDEGGRVVVANRQAAALLGVPQNSLVGKRIEHMRRDFVDDQGQAIEPSQLPYSVCLKSGRAVEDACVGFRGFPGGSDECHWFSVSAIPLYRPDEVAPHGVLSSFSEITERLAHDEQLKSHVKALAAAHDELQQRQAQLEQANARLESLAVTDGLTGLYNHRAFQERLEEELARATGDLSLVLVDVDHFKNYNDAFGHPEGDLVLRRVANLLKDLVGPHGVAARYGGEEFTIILPGCDADTSRAFTEELCAAVADAPWPNSSVTISAGVATTSAVCATPTCLIRAADEALYASKHGGRNRATHVMDLRAAA